MARMKYIIILSGSTERVKLLYCSDSWDYIFQYCQVGKRILVRLDPVENSAVAAQGKTFSWDSNTRRVCWPRIPDLAWYGAW